jgi:hypothetical protein
MTNARPELPPLEQQSYEELQVRLPLVLRFRETQARLSSLEFYAHPKQNTLLLVEQVIHPTQRLLNALVDFVQFTMAHQLVTIWMAGRKLLQPIAVKGQAFSGVSIELEKRRNQRSCQALIAALGRQELVANDLAITLADAIRTQGLGSNIYLARLYQTLLVDIRGQLRAARDYVQQESCFFLLHAGEMSREPDAVLQDLRNFQKPHIKIEPMVFPPEQPAEADLSTAVGDRVIAVVVKNEPAQAPLVEKQGPGGAFLNREPVFEMSAGTKLAALEQQQEEDTGTLL